MNPMSNVKGITRLNEKELELGLAGTGTSWHKQYKDSAWVFMGGLPYDLTEGDVICIFSQYGEVVNINLVRDKSTGKFKGYGFLCYEDQRSTILAVDNFNGIQVLGRTIRVDHVANYRPPKEFGDEDEVTKQLREAGCAPKDEESGEEEEEEDYVVPVKKVKKEKKKKAKKEKKKKKKRKVESSSNEESTDLETEAETNKGRHQRHSPTVRVKQEKMDKGYDKYAHVKEAHTKGHRHKDQREHVSEKSNKYQEKYVEQTRSNGEREERTREGDRRRDRDYTKERSKDGDYHKRTDTREKERHGEKDSRGDRDYYYRDRDSSRDTYRREKDSDRERDRHKHARY